MHSHYLQAKGFLHVQPLSFSVLPSHCHRAVIDCCVFHRPSMPAAHDGDQRLLDDCTDVLTTLTDAQLDSTTPLNTLVYEDIAHRPGNTVTLAYLNALVSRCLKRCSIREGQENELRQLKDLKEQREAEAADPNKRRLAKQRAQLALTDVTNKVQQSQAKVNHVTPLVRAQVKFITARRAAQTRRDSLTAETNRLRQESARRQAIEDRRAEHERKARLREEKEAELRAQREKLEKEKAEAGKDARKINLNAAVVNRAKKAALAAAAAEDAALTRRVKVDLAHYLEVKMYREGIQLPRVPQPDTSVLQAVEEEEKEEKDEE